MTTRSFQELAGSDSRHSRTRIVLTGMRSAFIGPNLIDEPYRTAVPTIIIGLENNIALRWTEGADDSNPASAYCVIPPNKTCELETTGPVAILFTDALNDDCSQIDCSETENTIHFLRDKLKAGPTSHPPEKFIRDIFERLGVVSSKPVRSEVAKVVSLIGRAPEDFPTVEQAAAVTNLSPMRFQHVFTEATGMPFRRYRQWRRMGRVIRLLADGENLTQAAYGAGFSSSSHLSTAFKDMFGLRPSTLLSQPIEYFLSDAELRDAD